MLLYGREPTLPTEASLNNPVNNVDVQQIRERALQVRSLAVMNIQNKQQKVRYGTTANIDTWSFNQGTESKSLHLYER